jgi:hypothetical protein
MASSTSRRPEPWIPEVPDNEAEIMRSMRAYRDALILVRRQQGIPGLMAELTRINAAQQEMATRSLSSALSGRLTETVSRLDALTPRSRPTASPSAASERGRASEASPSRQREPLSPRSPSSGGLGRAAAERIAMAQLRAESRRMGG